MAHRPERTTKELLEPGVTERLLENHKKVLAQRIEKLDFIIDKPTQFEGFYAAAKPVVLDKKVAKKIEPKTEVKKKRTWIRQKSSQEQLDGMENYLHTGKIPKFLFSILKYVPSVISFPLGLLIAVGGVITTIIPFIPGSMFYISPIGIAMMGRDPDTTSRYLGAIWDFCDKYSVDTIVRFVKTGRVYRKVPKTA